MCVWSQSHFYHRINLQQVNFKKVKAQITCSFINVCLVTGRSCVVISQWKLRHPVIIAAMEVPVFYLQCYCNTLGWSEAKNTIWPHQYWRCVCSIIGCSGQPGGCINTNNNRWLYISIPIAISLYNANKSTDCRSLYIVLSTNKW